MSEVQYHFDCGTRSFTCVHEGDLTPVRAYVGDAGIEMSVVQTEIFADT